MFKSVCNFQTLTWLISDWINWINILTDFFCVIEKSVEDNAVQPTEPCTVAEQLGHDEEQGLHPQP